MATRDLTDGWSLDEDDGHVVLYGPGGLEIALTHFDPARLRYEPGLHPSMIGPLEQYEWVYPIETLGADPESTLFLTLIVTKNPTPGSHVREQYLLHVGGAVVWQLPVSVGQQLDAWCASKEIDHA